MMEETVYILTGGNMGDRATLLDEASQRIGMAVGRITGASSYYESEPWGFQSDRSFLNQVLEVRTSLSPREVLRRCLGIEAALGRKRDMGAGHTDRPMDIDILFYGTQVLDEPDLCIPHPRMHERRFTLMPLAEIAPQFIHPLSGRSAAALLGDCPDRGMVIKLDGDAKSPEGTI